MSKEKQIEEMAEDLAGRDSCKHLPKDLCNNRKCSLCEAEILYEAGYRKQSEGEWVTSDIPQEKYVCSVCGGACWYYDYQGDVAQSRYCPNCGAHMRKEDEGK